MKKLLFVSALVLFLVLVSVPFLSQAAWHHHHRYSSPVEQTPSPAPKPTPSPTPVPAPNPTPNPAPTPPATPNPSPSANLSQWGAYTGNSQARFNQFAAQVGKTPQWQQVYSDFTFPSGFTGNLLIYPEAKTINDTQILAGALDSQIKAFATAAAKYPYQIHLPLKRRS